MARVVDDDQSVREAVCALLESSGRAARPFASVPDFIAKDDPVEPGCLILDIRLPGISGIEAQRRAATLGITLPIIFITAHGDISMGVDAMKRGAVDFLPKPFGEQQLLDAVDMAVELDLRRRGENAVRHAARHRYEALTAREREIFALIVAGRKNREIAGALGLSEVTVKMHRGSLMRKLAADSVIELVSVATAVGA